MIGTGFLNFAASTIASSWVLSPISPMATTAVEVKSGSRITERLSASGAIPISARGPAGHPRRSQPDPPGGAAAVAEVDIVNGCCLMVRRDLIASIGFIDEEFFLVHEESDLCLRSQRAVRGDTHKVRRSR